MGLRIINSLAFCSLIFISTSSFGQWQPGADAQMNRSEVNSVVYNGKLYAFMGFADSSLNMETTSEVYDPVKDEWNLLAAIPQGKEMTHQGVVLIDDNVWHIGGRLGRHPGPLTNEIWIYNITSDTWWQGPSIIDPATGDPIKWGAGGAALLGRTLHIFGGFIIDACDHDQDKYHLTLNVDEWLADTSKPAKWENKLAPMPVKRNHFATVVLGGKIYAIGGQFGHDCGGGQDEKYSHVYDPLNDTWTELPQLPAPRSHIEGSTFAIDGKIYVVAGQGKNGGNSNKVYTFDPNGERGVGEWAEEKDLRLPSKYEGLSAKIINSKFITDHGGEGSSRQPRNSTYKRDIVRSPVYRLGFTPDCGQIQSMQGKTNSAKTLLFTIDSTAKYTTSSNATWLTINQNKTGMVGATGAEIGLTANSSGLSPGTYKASVTAKAAGYDSASYCVSFEVLPDTLSKPAPVNSPDTLEAELAELRNAVVATNHTGYTGKGFVNFINDAGDFIEWTLNKSSAGIVDIYFRYANDKNDSRPVELMINGVVVADSLEFPKTGTWDDWKDLLFSTVLQQGTNKIRLTTIGRDGANIDHLRWKDQSVLSAGILEAETAKLHDVLVDTKHTGFTGDGFADYIHPSGDYIEWELDKSNSGSVALSFRYANGLNYDRPLRLEINGVVVADSLAFPTTGEWTNWSTATFNANLIKGSNKIRLTAIGLSGPNMDHLSWKENPVLTAMGGNQLFMPAETGTPQFASELQVSVMPNPLRGNGRIFLRTNDALPVEIKVADMLGRVQQVLSFKNYRSGYQDFSVNNLPAGIYFLIVKQGVKTAAVRFMVEK